MQRMLINRLSAKDGRGFLTNNNKAHDFSQNISIISSGSGFDLCHLVL